MIFPKRRWPVTEQNFVVAYEGPGVEDGRISVRQLAPALLAVGDLVERSNSILNGEAAGVSVKIRPSSKRGSALLSLALDVGLADQIHAFVEPNSLTNAAELLAILGFLDPEGRVVQAAGQIKNVIDLIRTLSSGEVKDKTVYEDGSAQYEIEAGGDVNIYKADGDIVLVGEDNKIQTSYANLISTPLQDPLLDGFTTRDPDDEDKVVERVSKDEARLFKQIEDMRDREPVDSGEFTDWVTVRKAWTVESSRKWQFQGKGGQPFNAPIRDEGFWEDVRKDLVPPTPHAKFKVRVEWVQRGEDDFEYEVTDVLDYKPAEPQAKRLDLSSPPKGLGAGDSEVGDED